MTTSKRPEPCARTSAPYAAAASARPSGPSLGPPPGPSSGAGMGWTRSGSTGTRSRRDSVACRSLRSGESRGTYRSSPHQRSTRDQSTRSRDAVTSASWIRAPTVPPVRATDGTLPSPWASASRATRRAATSAARTSRDGWRMTCGLLISLLGGTLALGRARTAGPGHPLGRRRVDVVRVETPQLLVEELVEVATLEGDGPVRLSRGGEGRQPAVGAGDRHVPVLGGQHHGREAGTLRGAA